MRSGSEMLFRTLSLKKTLLVSDSALLGCFRTLRLEGEHTLSQIPRFSGTFEHASLGSCSEKEHALSQILHFSSTFKHFFRKQVPCVSVSALFPHFQTSPNIHPPESILPPGHIFFSCGSPALPAQRMRTGLRKEIPLTNAVHPLSLERMCSLIRRCFLMRR